MARPPNLRIARQVGGHTLHRPPASRGNDANTAAAYPAPSARQQPTSLISPSTPPFSWRPGRWEIEAKDGLPSADRNNKATLLLTGPFRTAKSSAKDLTPLVLKLQYAKYHDALPAPWRDRLLRR
ncbi:hypothetical protein E4U19_007600 [Claviceps sp. Clav32 group G5]|nr:hypothetical protein E4U19_007600 [Claviceps sp. Clav32 group G5]